LVDPESGEASGQIAYDAGVGCGAVLKENQIKDIIAYIRILGRDLPTATQADVRRSSSRNTK
jgi:hypothetical protein